MDNNRVVGFIDMDAFYIAVEMHGPFKSRLGSDTPAAVVQYNSGEKNTADCGADDTARFNVKDGTIIAVNYPARARGVKRNMRGREAHKACPECVLVRVPTKHGKADLTIYKQAGNNVVGIQWAHVVDKYDEDSGGVWSCATLRSAMHTSEED